jgi:hypothetical protein
MSNRIGFYICHCGVNIAGKVDVEEVAKFARGLDNVVVARDYKFMCSDPGLSKGGDEPLPFPNGLCPRTGLMGHGGSCTSH